MLNYFLKEIKTYKYSVYNLHLIYSKYHNTKKSNNNQTKEPAKVYYFFPVIFVGGYLIVTPRPPICLNFVVYASRGQKKSLNISKCFKMF